MDEFAALRNQPVYEEVRDERGVLISRTLVQHYASRPHRADDMHPGRADDCTECAPKYQSKPLMSKPYDAEATRDAG